MARRAWSCKGLSGLVTCAWRAIKCRPERAEFSHPRPAAGYPALGVETTPADQSLSANGSPSVWPAPSLITRTVPSRSVRNSSTSCPR